MAKKLFVMVSDGGDGSYYPEFTLNPDLILKLQTAYDLGTMDWENGIGCDGDGFHYTTINVPDDSTSESLGVTSLPDDYADRFLGDQDD